MKLNMDFWREVFQKQIEEVKPRDNWRLTMDQNLDFYEVEFGWKYSLQEHAHASFTCSRCLHSWSSHQVVILFHMHWERRERQGCVKMRLYRQQCHKCSSTKFEQPEFTEEDVTWALEHLTFNIRKYCYRDRPDDSELPETMHETSGPHKRDYCEACQLGIHTGHYHRIVELEGASKAIESNPLSSVWPRDEVHNVTPDSTGSTWSCVLL